MRHPIFVPAWTRQQFIDALVTNESCGKHYDDPNHCNCKAYHTKNYNKMKKRQLIAVWAKKGIR